ncbi:MAG: hypothetical protein Q8R20_01095 [Nanoarchaeota archaeon]|nr:hypothetical protein [Nanoarchaeota archaeon]
MMENPETKSKTGSIIEAAKIASLGLLGVAASLAMVGYAEKFFASGASGYAGLALLFAGLFLMVVGLETLFTRHVGALFFVACLQAASPLALFMEELNTPGQGRMLVLLGAGALLFFQAIGMKRGRDVLENSIKIGVFQTAKAALPKVMTGILIFASLLFYVSYFVRGGWTDTIGKRLSDGLWKGAEPLLKIWIEDARMDMTVDEFLRAATEAQIRKLKTMSAREEVVEFNLDLLAAEEREERTREIVEKLRGELERVAGPLRGEEKAGDAFYQMLKKQFKETGLGSPEFGPFAGGVIALLVFGFLKSFAFLIVWIAEMGVFLMFQLLLAAGFAKVRFESANRERIEL